MSSRTSPNGISPPLETAIKDRTQRVIHLTHNDLDAVGCDAIHRMKYGEVFTIWCSVGNFIPMLASIARAPGRGDTLSISDLGFQPGIETWLALARENGWRIEWCDHHRWRDDELRKVREYVDILQVDPSVCATGIISENLLPGNAVAHEIAGLVCDYDLWRHQDPRSKILGQVVMHREYRDYVRDRLICGIFIDDAIERKYAEITREMEEDIQKSIRYTRIFENRYKIVFAPLYGYPSETAHSIRDVLDSDIEVVISPNGRFSIRSVPPISHLIAREFSGGGHPHAAGGRFEFTFVDKIFFWLFKNTRHFKKLVDISEYLGSSGTNQK